MTDTNSGGITEAARTLASEYRRCARTGTLIGGVLAYTAEGPGEWFPAGSFVEGDGTFAIHVTRNALISAADAEQMIRNAAAGLPWDGTDEDED